MFLHGLHTGKNNETFRKLLISKDDSPAVRMEEEIEASKFMKEKLLKRFIELYIIIRNPLQENSSVHHVRDASTRTAYKVYTIVLQ